MNKDEFLSLRKKIIENQFGKLNNMQKKAVFSVEGPLLVLAGAGSGKTTVLVNRIANIIRFGNSYYSDNYYDNLTDYEIRALQNCSDGGEIPADIEYLLKDNPARPWEILAITFTNKAAGELKRRINDIIGEGGNDVWASTFHSACTRILRRNADSIGFSSNFTIYDTDDSKRVIKECLKELKLSDKLITPKAVLNEISNAKDYLITPDEYINNNSGNYLNSNIGQVYKLYQEKLKYSDALDFDDIIYYTVRMFDNNPVILEYYQRKFRYILVDEYQDTNHLQYLLISMLAAGHKNICVVGDDDQSIYRFRGATIENILTFENEYPGAKVIRLEQNYRSTQNILNAANEVIANNINRKGKNLWSDKGDGDKITLKISEDDREEGWFVADTITKAKRNGKKFSDFAVLYRMNSQSNPVEQALVQASIPYSIIGGHKFYDRKEIKDAVAYLTIINNSNDVVRMSRIINEPKRGIGDTTFSSILEISENLNMGLLEVMKSADEFPKLSRMAGKVKAFASLIEELKEFAEENTIDKLLTEILDKTGYIASLDSEPERKQDRLENLDQLLNNIKNFQQENPEATLNDFLQEISLMTDIDSYNSENDSVILMTVHAAKGLEFNTVFLVGMEENIFPSDMSVSEGDVGVEEERRLAYVAITRAKEKLYLSNCKTRMLFGMTRYNPPSRFIKEIPETYLDIIENKKPAYNGRNTIAGGNSGNNRIQIDKYSVSGIHKKEKSTASYRIGDTVEHKTWGQGVITSITEMGNDTLLEVAFIEGKSKKIMANYANLKKINHTP